MLSFIYIRYYIPEHVNTKINRILFIFISGFVHSILERSMKRVEKEMLLFSHNPCLIKKLL